MGILPAAVGPQFSAFPKGLFCLKGELPVFGTNGPQTSRYILLKELGHGQQKAPKPIWSFLGRWPQTTKEQAGQLKKKLGLGVCRGIGRPKDAPRASWCRWQLR